MKAIILKVYLIMSVLLIGVLIGHFQSETNRLASTDQIDSSKKERHFFVSIRREETVQDLTEKQARREAVDEMNAFSVSGKVFADGVTAVTKALFDE